MAQQRTSILILALSFALACTGCRTEQKDSTIERRDAQRASSTPEATVAQAPPQKADERPVLVAFGDSLTAGVAGRSYPEQLQDVLDANQLPFRVENQGVSGDTTTDGSARIDNVVASHPVLVILEFGGNDGLRGVPIDTTRRNLEGMMTRLKEKQIPFVLLGITLPPNYGPEYVKPFTAMYPSLARKYDVPYLPFLLAHVYLNQALMQPDGIHPNGAGNKIVAQDVFVLIRPLLEPSAARH